MGSSLVIRRSEDGARIQGDPPDAHTFPASFLARELASGLVEVTVTLRPVDADPVVYRMTGFEELDDGRPNISGWKTVRTEERG